MRLYNQKRTISKTKVKSSQMKTLKYALTLAATFMASSVALELSSTSSAISSASSGTSSSKCNHSTSNGMRYCEFSGGDVVLTCDEIQSPSPPNQLKV